MTESLLFTIGKKFSYENKQKDNSERVVCALHHDRSCSTVRLHVLDENILYTGRERERERDNFTLSAKPWSTGTV
jgi:hypothetical protein